MIKYFYKSLKSGKLEQVEGNRNGAWIRITDATNEDITVLSQALKIDSNDIIDCLDEYEIPRIEKIDKGLLMILKVPKSQGGSNYTETFSIIITDENVATVSLTNDEFLDNLKHSKNNINTTQKYKIVFSFLLKITELFTFEIKKVRHQVLSNLAVPKYTNLTESRIVNLTNDDEILSQYLAVMIPMKLVFMSLKSGTYFKVFEEDADLLEDITLSITQSVELASTNMKSIRSLRDSYQILFTNKLNKEIRILTYLTIFLTIPTLIASFFGMNVPLPLQNNHLAPVIILGLSVASIGGVFYFLFRLIKK